MSASFVAAAVPRFTPNAASASARRRRRVRTECCWLLIAIDCDDARCRLRSVEAALGKGCALRRAREERLSVRANVAYFGSNGPLGGSLAWAPRAAP